MSYQSRKRNYKSRRQRWADTMRNTRLVLIFGAIALVVLMFKNRYEFWNWFQTFFY